MLRELHLGNVANVAYGYCKLLRNAGHDASVLCYDLDHPLSQPEWYEGDFPTSDHEEQTFDPSEPRYAAFRPPDWYRRVTSAEFWPQAGDETGLWALDDEWIDTLVRFSRRYGKRWALTRDDILAYKLLVEALAKSFFGGYDVIFGYAYAAVPPLLYSMTPYVPVEIGTMREVPFEDNSLGRLLAMAYRTAPHVIVTNPDVRSAAEELGVERYSFVPHPVDSEVWRPGTDEERHSLHQDYGADYLILAPARQNWRLKGNDKYFRAFAQVINTIGPKAKLLVATWGQEIERSKQLVKELGIEDFVVWLNPVPEMTLARMYQAVDLVFDQFGDCGTFGLITPKAMSCGVPVLINYKPQLHNWCYSAHPPLTPVYTEEEIFHWTLQYLLQPGRKEEASQQSREWILNHHSEKVITEKIGAIVEEVCPQGPARPSTFFSLKQKRLELSYEAAYVECYDQLYHRSVASRMMDDILVSSLRTLLEGAGFRAPAVLDLGCGPGSLTDKLLSIPNVRLTGVDISAAMIRRARQRFPQVQFSVDDAEALPFEDNSLEAVFCSGVLHHLPSLQMALSEIRRVLKPGGFLVAREPNERNFAALFPELAFAHLCLRHYLLNALAMRQPAEPEPHQFHRALDFATFTQEVGEQFLVRDFHTGLHVSYFYDMFTDSGMRLTLEALDDTLDGTPGLNVVVIAEKAERTGVSEPAMRRMLTETSRETLDTGHFHRLCTFAKSVFAEHKAELYQDVRDSDPRDFGYRYLQRHPHARALICGDDTGQCQQRAYEYAWRLSQDERKGRSWLARVFGKSGARPAVTVKALDQLAPEDCRYYDMGVFLLNQDPPPEKAAALMDCVRDYGLICIEARRGARLERLGLDSEGTLANLAVLREAATPLPEPTHFLFLSRHLYSPRDFYRALAVAMDKTRAAPAPVDAARRHALLAEVGAELLAREKEFSHLASSGLQPSEELLSALKPSDHGTS